MNLQKQRSLRSTRNESLSSSPHQATWLGALHHCDFTLRHRTTLARLPGFP